MTDYQVLMYVVCLLVFLLLLSVFFGLVVFGSFKSQREINARLSDKISQLHQKLLKADKAIVRANQEICVLEDKLREKEQHVR